MWAKNRELTHRVTRFDDNGRAVAACGVRSLSADLMMIRPPGAVCSECAAFGD